MKHFIGLLCAMILVQITMAWRLPVDEDIEGRIERGTLKVFIESLIEGGQSLTWSLKI